MRNDADDRPILALAFFAGVHPNAFPDGILPGEITIRQHLIDDHDRRHVFRVPGLERPAAQQRRFHRLKIAGRDDGHFRRRQLARLRFRRAFRAQMKSASRS